MLSVSWTRNMINISAREDDLFRRWRQVRPSLVRDGIVDEEAYVESNLRVVLVLKEANSEHGGWDLRKKLAASPNWQTWSTVTRWVRGLRQLDRSLPWSEIAATPSVAERAEALRSICVVNLKKEAGGSQSNHDAIARFAREDASFLAEQFELCDPDVVICGGVGDLVNQVMRLGPWARTSRGLEFVQRGKCHVLNYYHPQVRYPIQMLYYSLIDGVRELKGHR